MIQSHSLVNGIFTYTTGQDSNSKRYYYYILPDVSDHDSSEGGPQASTTGR